jgi:hypothetical protein
LVLVKTDLPLSGLERLLHDPTNPRYPHKLGKSGRPGCPAAIEGQLTGGGVAADQQTVPAVVAGVTVGADVGEPGPVVEPWPFRPVTGTASGPRGGGQVLGQTVGTTAGLSAVDRHEMIAGDGQDVTQAQFPQPGPQAGVVAVGLVRGDPSGRTRAWAAAVIMSSASSDRVANVTSSGTPACSHRWWSSVQDFGR